MEFLNGTDYCMSRDSLKLKYIVENMVGQDDVEVHVEVLTVGPTKSCIKFTYRDPIN